MKILLTLLVILLFIVNVSAQKIATKKIKQDPFYFDNFNFVENGEESFIISKYKTTNKDYLCFLQWTNRVYRQDYPEEYNAMLPDTTKYPDLFNPEKANDPVKGVTHKQAEAFCQWRSDRLNEYILIREGIMKKDFSQMNANSFSTESYLTLHYNGLIKNDLLDLKTHEARPVIQSDYILVPGFYIASKEELRLSDSLMKLKSIDPDPPRIKSDLDWWYKNEFEFSESDMNNSPLKFYNSKLKNGQIKNIKKHIKTLQKDLGKKVIDYNPAGVLVSTKDYRTFNIYHLKPQTRYYSVFCDSLPNPFAYKKPYNTEEKNEQGKMSYRYIADNFDGKPICLYRTEFENQSGSNISESGFYCAMNMPYRIMLEIQKHSLLGMPGSIYRY
jgi:hypothetical protein